MTVAAGSPLLYLGHASPTCSAGQTLQSNACNPIQGLGLRGVGLADSSEFRFSNRFLELGCGRCRNMLEPLPAFFGVCRVPQGGGLYTGGSFSQEEESTVTFENCISGASVASGSALGNDVWGS